MRKELYENRYAIAGAVLLFVLAFVVHMQSREQRVHIAGAVVLPQTVENASDVIVICTEQGSEFHCIAGQNGGGAKPAIMAITDNLTDEFKESLAKEYLKQISQNVTLPITVVEVKKSDAEKAEDLPKTPLSELTK